MNTAPECDAGGDLVATVDEAVSLIGSGSSDADGDELTYAWTLDSAPSGSAASIDDDDLDVASLTADLEGDYEITLTVSDGTDSCTDSITVEATEDETNNVPVCDAGGDLTATVGETVTIDGTGSSDPDGDELSWSWVLRSEPSGSAATISDKYTSTPSIVPDLEGDYEIRMWVSDGDESCRDDITITVTDAPSLDNSRIIPVQQSSNLYG